MTLAKLGKHGARTLLGSAGYKINRLQDCDVLLFLLHTLLKKQPRLSVIQIGANDGVTSDPIYEFVAQHSEKVHGVLLEPVKDYFEQLVRNYARFPAMKPVNAAIHRTEKQMTIHRIKPTASGSGKWSQGIASFDPSHRTRSNVPAEVMTTESVNCMTFEELLRAQDIRSVDLLQIDTEGYDAEIIRSINFDVVKPRILRFEHGKLKTMPKAVFLEMRALLHEQGYELMLETFDCTAYQPSVVLDALT